MRKTPCTFYLPEDFGSSTSDLVLWSLSRTLTIPGQTDQKTKRPMPGILKTRSSGKITFDGLIHAECSQNLI